MLSVVGGHIFGTITPSDRYGKFEQAVVVPSIEASAVPQMSPLKED